MNKVIDNLEVGQSFKEVIVENLSRTQIVQYAGASGDFNPLHTDEVFAKDVAGYPSTFAHGMLGMALTSKLLTKLFDNNSIKKFGVRFQSIIWPGDTLTTDIIVTSIETINDSKATDVKKIELEINTSNQDGQVVIKGTAVIVI
jgi:acyl dehydratase